VIAHCLLTALPTGKKPSHFPTWIAEAATRWKVTDTDELAGHVWGSFLYLRTWMAGANPWGVDWTTGALIVEKSYAIQVLGGSFARIIGPPSEEDHIYAGLEPGEIPATLDVMVLAGKGRAIPPLVLDHKTGHGKDFSSPSQDDQMRTLALIPDLGEAIVAINHADRRGLPMIYADPIGPVDLQKHRVRLRTAVERIGDGSMRPGDWCTYCPAKTVCPTQYSTLIPSALAIASSVDLVITTPEWLDGLTVPEKVGRMHLFKSAMTAMLKKVDDEIHRYVRANPGEVVTRPDGKHLEFITRAYETLSKRAFEEALGKIEAEKWFVKLRKLNVLVKTPREELRAVAEHGE
jgi:hypothetical protein